MLSRLALPIVWVTVPFLAGPAFADALDPSGRAFQLVASLGLWAVWGATLAAALVPRSITLTAVRIIVPASIVASAWAALAAPGGVAVAGIVAVTTAVVATVLAFAPFTGDVFVNGSSYGDERRMALRAPAALLIGPLELAWLVCVVGVCAGPLLLGAQAWIAGTVAILAGWPAAFLAARALHGLSQRWVVFVPAGFVLHDQMAIADPLLMPRSMVRSIGPALEGSAATDFTLGALGLVLQVDLREPTDVVPVPRRTAPGQRPSGEAVEVRSILFSPSRPGAVIREARARRLPVG